MAFAGRGDVLRFGGTHTAHPRWCTMRTAENATPRGAAGNVHAQGHPRPRHTPAHWYRQRTLPPFHGLIQRFTVGDIHQVSAALEVFADEFPIVGLAKRLETIIIKTEKGFEEVRPQGPALRLVQRLRDEAHRFARKYHHKLVSMAIKTT